jgi:hypothetical protein
MFFTILHTSSVFTPIYCRYKSTAAKLITLHILHFIESNIHFLLLHQTFSRYRTVKIKLVHLNGIIVPTNAVQTGRTCSSQVGYHTEFTYSSNRHGEFICFSQFSQSQFSWTYLTQVDGKVDLVVFDTAWKWRTLPPSLCTVHRILCGVRLVRLAGVTVIAHL